MALEIEAKMPVEPSLDLEPLLRSLHAEPIYRVIERDAFFDDEAGSLRAADRGLRLRVRRLIDSDEPPTIWITHKGPLQSGDVKKRHEIEFAVDAAEPVIALFAQFGYAMTIRYEKRRDRWRLDDCWIELDQIPYLGRFVEIEGPDEATVMAVRAKLGLAGAPLLTDSYIKMLSRHLNEQHIADRDVRFADDRTI